MKEREKERKESGKSRIRKSLKKGNKYRSGMKGRKVKGTKEKRKRKILKRKKTREKNREKWIKREWKTKKRIINNWYKQGEGKKIEGKLRKIKKKTGQ